MEPPVQSLFIFSALPWMLAGGLLGPLPAAILGFFSGILQALWGSHTPFLPLETTLLAILFSAMVNQRFRTYAFGLIRKPLIASLILVVLYPLLYFITTTFTINQAFVIQLDYAINRLLYTWLTTGIELIFAGALAQLVFIRWPETWGLKTPLQPSPAERSLQVRFFYSMAPLGLLLVLTLITGSWIVTTSVARDLLQKQMETTAGIVAEQLPYFIGTGQALISGLAEDPRLSSSSVDDLYNALAELIKTSPYFNQLILLDGQGELLVAYPDSQMTGQQTPNDEVAGIELALHGMASSPFTIPPRLNGLASQISFVKLISPTGGDIPKVLIGRTDLGENPLSQPLIRTLNEMSSMQGEGMILDENDRILSHPNPALVMTTYPDRVERPGEIVEQTRADGARSLVYQQPALGIPWTVVTSIPLAAAQQLSTRIAAPLLGIITVLTILGVISTSLALRIITNSLKDLADEAQKIADGYLESTGSVDEVDEIGQARQALERIRTGFKGRLGELNLLIEVGRGVVSHMDLNDAIQPVLDAALAMGGNSSRIILAPAVIPETDGNPTTSTLAFSASAVKDLYRELDEQILGLTRQKAHIILSSLTRPRLLTLSTGQPYPSSLIACALRYEGEYLGALWVAYDQPHTFPDEEVRYLAILADQAAIAVANTRLFLNAEIGRQRLAAILTSNPDAILATDQNNRLILANPAAWRLFGIGIENGIGKPIEQVIVHKELLDLFKDSASENLSIEVTFRKEQIYLATIFPFEREGIKLGRVCVLRDVTRIKEADALKSEFVSTVSHDLRSPLALIRGNATMLEMVGQLNEQQKGFVRKILGSVEVMLQLVNNLLDLGRIEAGIGLQVEPISAHNVVERVVSTMQLQATQKKIQLKTEYPAQGKAIIIEADPALLQQALQNLVDNAIKYTRNDGRVTLRVVLQGERVIFEVNDNGIGISPMDQARLFEKFYRGPQLGLPESQGSGLGLAIVRSIAERHHGNVWAESQLGAGSTFYLAIPFAQKKG
jgi:PAS domain S-box-containing protein